MNILNYKNAVPSKIFTCCEVTEILNLMKRLSPSMIHSGLWKNSIEQVYRY